MRPVCLPCVLLIRSLGVPAWDSLCRILVVEVQSHHCMTAFERVPYLSSLYITIVPGACQHRTPVECERWVGLGNTRQGLGASRHSRLYPGKMHLQLHNRNEITLLVGQELWPGMVKAKLSCKKECGCSFRPRVGWGEVWMEVTRVFSGLIQFTYLQLSAQG